MKILVNNAIYRRKAEASTPPSIEETAQQLHAEPNFRNVDWLGLQELLRAMGWTVISTNKFVRNEFTTSFVLDETGTNTYRNAPSWLEDLLSKPFNTRQELGNLISSRMENPKFKNKQPKSEVYFDHLGPDSNYVSAVSKPPKNEEVIPGRMYVTKFSLTTPVKTDVRVTDPISTIGSITWGYGVSGVDVTNPDGKSTFIPVDPSIQPDKREMNAVESALTKLKFKSAFKEWSRGSAATKRKTITPERTIENTGTCPVCSRNIKLTHGVMVDHGYQVPWSRGGRTQGCFGVGYPPYEKSPQGCEAYLKALYAIREDMVDQRKLLNSATEIPHPRKRDEIIREGDPMWKRYLTSAQYQIENSIQMLNKDALETQKRIDDWKLRPLPEEIKRR